jgi:trehalose/maltose hydrolase-like predicted phosphorylase
MKFEADLAAYVFAALFSGLGLHAWAETDPSFLLSAGPQDLENYFPAYLANGYVSSISAPRGTEGNPAYLVAFMDYTDGDISRPAAIPGWTEIDYSTGPSAMGQSWLNKAPLLASRFSDYRQTLDLHAATLTTRYRYFEGRKQTMIQVVTFVSQAAPHLAASELSITPDFDGTVQLSFALNLWAPHAPRLPLGQLSGAEMEEALAARRLKLDAIPPATADRAAIWYPGDTHVLASDGDSKDLTLWLRGRAEQGLAMAQAAAVRLPEGLIPEEVHVYRSPYRLALNLSVKVQKGKTYRFAKFVAFSREGWGADANQDLTLAQAARTAGFDQLLIDHEAAWQHLWKTDILIDGDAPAQQLVHSELYYLLSSSTSDTAWPLGACAMTPGYAGHAFWDSDSWIFPALLLLHPERAKSLVMFRQRTLPAAQARAQAHGYQGAMYPWESDPENGSEQTPHFAYVLGDREIHVNADIAIAQWQYYLAAQDRDWLRRYGWPVIRNIAQFWTSRASYNPRRRRYEILHVTSVREEFSDVPNDTFTNASAARALNIATSAAAVVGELPDPRWKEIAQHLYLPFDTHAQHHLDFDPTVLGQSDSWAGSALPFLSYPSLDLPMSRSLRRNDYDYAMHPDAELPQHAASMGLAPSSIAAAAAGDATTAVAWFQQNFTGGTIKPPYNVRTETDSNNTGYFLTASGGFIENLVYGFSGLRLQDEGLMEVYPPVLPAAWKSLTLRNIAFRGQHYDVLIARDPGGRVTLTRVMPGFAGR